MRERVLSALESSGFRVPARKIVIQVLPECLREGSQALDFAAAMVLLASEGIFSIERLHKIAVLGGLRLDGSLSPVVEALALPSFFQKQLFSSALLPYENSEVLKSAQLDGGGGFQSLKEAVDFLNRRIGRGKRREEVHRPSKNLNPNYLKIEQVEGHASAKQMLLAVAAGGHHSLLFGPRGVGKSFLASALPSILPPITVEEGQEISAVYAMSGETWEGERPFRAPHASISRGNLLGGLGKNKFGELSLSHGGVLYLDEVLEMDRSVLESLRTPIEEGELRLRRGDYHYRLPCRTTLLASANLCPCGLLGDSRHACQCSRAEIRHYRRRISSALLDRIDLYYPLHQGGELETCKASTAEFRELATTARASMIARQGKANSRLQGEEVFQVKAWSASAKALWADSCQSRGYSRRSSVALARVAITFSDLMAQGEVQDEHLYQALFFRSDPL